MAILARSGFSAGTKLIYETPVSTVENPAQTAARVSEPQCEQEWQSHVAQPPPRGPQTLDASLTASCPPRPQTPDPGRQTPSACGWVALRGSRTAAISRVSGSRASGSRKAVSSPTGAGCRLARRPGLASLRAGKLAARWNAAARGACSGNRSGGTSTNSRSRWSSFLSRGLRLPDAVSPRSKGTFWRRSTGRGCGKRLIPESE